MMTRRSLANNRYNFARLLEAQLALEIQDGYGGCRIHNSCYHQPMYCFSIMDYVMTKTMDGLKQSSFMDTHSLAAISVQCLITSYTAKGSILCLLLVHCLGCVPFCFWKDWQFAIVVRLLVFQS
jgi:hypothetical protein